LGIEADIQGSAQRGSSTLVEYIKGTQCIEGLVYPPLVCLTTFRLRGTAVTDLEARIDWFGTIRERIGWLLTDDALLYVTGGLAYGHVSVSGNFNVSATTVPLFVKFGPSTNGFSSSETKIGFAVGAGIEGTCAAWVPPNWTWKLEYLYVDLGSLDTSTHIVATSSEGGISNLNGTATTHTRVTDNIVRVGLNYHF